MIAKKDIIISFILAISLFLLSFFFSRNWVKETCCDYRAQRLYGFPLTFISLSKTTKDYNEAQKVYSLGNFELISEGWEIKGGSDNINFPVSLLLNFLSYLLLSGIFVGLFNAFIFSLTQRIREGRT